MRKLLVLAAFAIGIGASAQATASEAMPQALAQQLDQQALEYSMTAAKQRRLYMMQEATRQQQYGRGGRGYDRGYGPRPRYGYGPGYGPGPRYGYGPGYGPRPGYGPPRDYGYRRY